MSRSILAFLVGLTVGFFGMSYKFLEILGADDHAKLNQLIAFAQEEKKKREGNA